MKEEWPREEPQILYKLHLNPFLITELYMCSGDFRVLHEKQHEEWDKWELSADAHLREAIILSLS